MEIRYNLRPTGIRTNARFRGPTESEKYTNFVGETAHDLKLLGKILDRDGFIFTYAKGQTDFIHDNMALYYSGRNENPTSNIPTSSKLLSLLQPIFVDAQIGAGWTSTGTVTTNGDGTQTLKGNAAVYTKVMNVVEGQKFYLTIKVKPKMTIDNNSVSGIRIGSSNVNQGEGSYTEFDLVEGADWKYISTIIECKHKESISIGIISGGTGVVPSEFIIDEFSLYEVFQEKYNLQPSNTVIKRRINTLEDEINNIINNI